MDFSRLPQHFFCGDNVLKVEGGTIEWLGWKGPLQITSCQPKIRISFYFVVWPSVSVLCRAPGGAEGLPASHLVSWLH